MRWRITLATLLGVVAGASAALGQTRDTLLRVSVSGAPDRAFSLAQLQALGADSARARFHGGPEQTFVGVPLGRVLAAAGRPVDSLRGRDLTQVVLVEAADGYRVVFALAELDPSFRGGERPPVLLVWAENGAPVAPGYGPLRIVAAEERRPSRWIRQVTRVSVFPVVPVTARRSAMDLRGLATRYAAAWSSRNPDRLAAFYADSGTLVVNASAPSVGRTAIRATVQGFMAAFPDMVVRMDSVLDRGDRADFHWTWTGTNTGPGGSGRAVRITGYEEWTLGPDGLIRESRGQYDEAEYHRQVDRRR